MNPYRQRILPLLLECLPKKDPVRSALDFGSGDGWFAQQLRQSGLVGELTPVDVKLRENTVVAPRLYDGATLPFPGRHFDLVYSVDVLHHCPDPAASLLELVRCSRRFVLLKDHTWRTRWGKWGLAILDELGNRQFGIPCLYRYQHRWDWFPIIENEGFRLVHPKEREPQLFAYRDPSVFFTEDGEARVLVTHAAGPAGNTDILIFASNSTFARAGAVDAFTEPDFVRNLVEKMRGPGKAIPRYYQVLLQVKYKGGVPTETSYILHRELFRRQ